MPHTNQLRFHRRQWALSQRQLAELLGLKSKSTVGDYERGRRAAGLRLALAYQFVFGAALSALHPGLAREVEDAVMRQAASLDDALGARDDGVARRIRECLDAMISRADRSDAV